MAKLVTLTESKIVVLSAMSGTTNRLVEISDSLYGNNIDKAKELISTLEQEYKEVVNELFASKDYLKGGDMVLSHLRY